MSTDEQTLIGSAHPYYCSEGNYYASGTAQTHLDYGSWAEFLEEWGDADEDYEMVFRWDWNTASAEDMALEPETPEHSLDLFWMAQRKARGHSTSIVVRAEDEPAIRDWLKPKAEYIRRIWAPLLALEPQQ